MTTETKVEQTAEEVDAVDNAVAEQASHLEMSDADFLKMAVPEEAPKAEVVVEKPAAEAKADETPASAKTDDAEAVDEPGASPGEEKPADASDKSKKTEKPQDTKAEKPAAEKPAAEAKPAEAAAVDFKSEYERLLTPFKANGRDIKIDSVDDAIALMQMGANYNKKMAGLKPNLKLLKMLENNGLLSEDKINFLIDLGKKDPAAINKLVKESGIDPMDLSAEKGEAYKPTTRAVDDREIDLDTVLDELQGSPTYARTLDVVSNKWDAASKQVVSQSPQLLKVINDHVASGIYDLISTEVERGRMLGRLNGVSDIEAYRQIGDSIQARGGFNHLGKPKADEKPAATVIVQPKPKPPEDDKLKDKRRAASSTQPAAPSTTPTGFNPLSLSDEEFSKLATPKFR